LQNYKSNLSASFGISFLQICENLLFALSWHLSQFGLLWQTGWCRQPAFISHSSGSYEIQDQGASGFGAVEGLFPRVQWLPSCSAFTW
jgi:hypothetical protein